MGTKIIKWLLTVAKTISDVGIGRSDWEWLEKFELSPQLLCVWTS